MSLLTKIKDFGKDNKILLASIGATGLIGGLVAYKYFVTNRHANIARQIPLDAIREAMKLLLRDFYLDLNLEVDNTVFEKAISQKIDIWGNPLLPADIDFYATNNLSFELVKKIQTQFFKNLNHPSLSSFVEKFEKALTAIDKRLTIEVFAEKVKQIEKDFDEEKLPLNKENYLMIGAISILEDAFCGRLQGGFHSKSYYMCLGLNYYRDPHSHDLGFTEKLPDELSTKNIMKIDLLLMLDSIKTFVEFAKSAGRGPGKSFRRIRETSRMVGNLIQRKTQDQLLYHPLLYYHAARATLMPQLEASNDEVFFKYIDLMMEYSKIQGLTQAQLKDYPTELFSDKVVAFIR